MTVPRDPRDRLPPFLEALDRLTTPPITGYRSAGGAAHPGEGHRPRPTDDRGHRRDKALSVEDQAGHGPKIGEGRCQLGIWGKSNPSPGRGCSGRPKSTMLTGERKRYPACH